jgi:hypothetical protein
MPWLAAVYGIRPWELERLTVGEIDVMLADLPDVQRTLASVQLVTYK